jgi:hypothetical protein
MHQFTTIGDELGIIHDGTVVYVFERDTTGRTAYEYMIRWIQDHASPGDDPGTTWARAETAWNALSPEIQAFLINMSRQEEAHAHAIYNLLYETLRSYPCSQRIKNVFVSALTSARSTFT